MTMEPDYGCTHAIELNEEEGTIITKHRSSLREIDEGQYDAHPLKIYQNRDFNDTYYVRFEGETDYMKGFVKSAFVRYCSFLIQSHWIPLEDEAKRPSAV